MRSWATAVCQIWVKYRWNLVIAGQNVLFWRWSIKRLDLQTTYKYRAENFSIYFHRIGLPSCVDKRSDLMRVSYSGTSKLKIPEILKICWPASEPCRVATSKYSDSIFPVRVLRIRAYPPRNWEVIDMRSLASVVCLNWVKYRWNLVIAGQNVLFWRWFIKRLDLHTTYRYRAVIFRIYSYRAGLPSFVDTRSDLMRVSYSGTSNWKFLKFWKDVDLHRSPVERQPVSIATQYFLCVSSVSMSTHHVIGKSLACVV